MTFVVLPELIVLAGELLNASGERGVKFPEARWLLISIRPVAQGTVSAFALCLFEEAIKFAGGGVFVHLIIPRRLISLYEKRCQRGQLFRRKLSRQLFDLGQAHGRIMPSRAVICNIRRKLRFERPKQISAFSISPTCASFRWCRVSAPCGCSLAQRAPDRRYCPYRQ